MAEVDGEAVVDGILEDVLERGLVLVLRLDHLRPEPSPEDVIAAAVPVIEGARVLAVQVPHSVREVRERCLYDEVVVVSHQAARVQLPAVVARNAAQELQEHFPIRVVEHDRRPVVAARRDVVVRAGAEIAMLATHRVRR